jgi:hypothetical protein
MSIKRVLYKRDTLYVENWRENALLWLNGNLPRRYYSGPARRRINQLVEALQQLSRPNAAGLRGRGRIPNEAFRSIKIVMRLLSRYPSWPTLGWDKEGNLSFGVDFGRLKRAAEEEAEAALAVMSLAEVNELIWLRRCLCGTWFFAHRKTQKSCSANCRHRLYEQTEAFKAKRRRYMKRYYRLQRSGTVK